MNCQDVSRILDDEDIARLTDDEQHALKLHLAFCPECARDWDLHAQLAASRIPSMPRELRTSCRTLVVAGAAAAKSSRTGNRYILIGTLLAVAAAAGMLGAHLLKPAHRAAAMPVPAVSAFDPPVLNAPMTEAVVPADTGEPEEVAPVAAAAASEVKSANSFTVAVLPLRQESGDPASRAAVESFYTLVLEKLRKVPDLVLVDEDTVAKYRIVVRGVDLGAAPEPGPAAAPESNPTVDLSSGVPLSKSLDMMMAHLSKLADSKVVPGSAQWRVELVVDMPQQMLLPDFASGQLVDPRTGSAMSYERKQDAHGVRFASLAGAYVAGACAPSLSQEPAEACSMPATLATWQVDLLRRNVFPVRYVLQELALQMQSTSATAQERETALMQLQTLTSGGKVSWDAANIATLVDMLNATVSAEQRIRIWNTLRGISSPALVQPLLAAMRNDPDEKVRLTTLTLLPGEYAANEPVRTVLETVAREDASELLRQAAQRLLYGDAGWRQYVVTTLRNGNLSDDKRLAPLGHMTRSSDLAAQLPAIMDDECTAVLAGILPRVWNSPEQSQAMVEVLRTLTQKGHPGATTLVAEALRTAPESQVTRLIISITSRYWDDPAARKLLDEAIARFPKLGTLRDLQRQLSPR